MKLLVVDDSLVVRNAIARSVNGGGAITEVLRAEDGNQAVELFQAHRPELVTMDLTMPNLDGLEAIARIRAIEPQASILVISALNSHRIALDAIQRGACGFLTKPFTEREVIEALEELVNHARTRDQ
ncbi:MAG TPA: response regulator [Thermoanaerobaculia bacterium]|nr:response regulator [Thermoanaerobaculia bacterium]